MSIIGPPPWASLQHLRDELAQATELLEAILQRFEVVGYVEDDVQAELDEQALEWAEGEQARAHTWLEHRERELKRLAVVMAAGGANRSHTTEEV